MDELETAALPETADAPGRPRGGERKAFALRIDPTLFAALRRWADDDLRSVNAQIEFLLARAVREAGRGPHR
jgi:hypothetical protein